MSAPTHKDLQRLASEHPLAAYDLTAHPSFNTRGDHLVMLRGLLNDVRVVDHERDTFSQMLNWLLASDERTMAAQQHDFVVERWKQLGLVSVPVKLGSSKMAGRP